VRVTTSALWQVGEDAMAASVWVPCEMLESVVALGLPRAANNRLQQLMDHHNNGKLTLAERKELEDLVEWSEQISLLRARALHLLGRKPQ
jgi:hypothetical protein